MATPTDAGPARWHVLGAGSILPRAGHGPAGYALRPSPGARVTLFDCGPGSIRSLASAGVGVEEVERVVVSHFHADHVLDLFALAFARRNPALRGVGPIELVGPTGLARRLEGVAAALGASVAFEDARCVEVEPREEPTRVRAGALELACARTRHTETSLAWRVDLGPGRSLTYSGDACEVPELARLAAGTDLFVAECSFDDEDAAPNHLTPSGAARLARAAGARRLLLSHFYPSVDPERAAAVAARTFPGPIEVAVDGSVHQV